MLVDVTVQLGSALDAGGERCGVSDGVLEQLDLFARPVDLSRPENRRQVRVRSPLNVGHDALCTLAENVAADMELSAAGSERAFAVTAPPPLPATIDTHILNQRLVELLDLRGDDWLAVLAPHGGNIERRTDQQAEQLAMDPRLRRRTPSLWRCRGTGADAFDRWHITSTDISEHSFPALGLLATNRFTHAVAFHGYDVDPKPGARPLDVIVGGRATRALKTRIRDEIRTAVPRELAETVDLAPARHPLGARQPENLVNRFTRAGGVQIEQSPAARVHWQEIAAAVAAALAPRY